MPNGMQSFIGLEAAVLNLAGSLFDSQEAHVDAWRQTLEEEGFTASMQELRKRFGMGGDRPIPSLTGVSDVSVPGRRMSERKTRIFRDRFLFNLKPQPCAHKLVEEL